MWIAHEVNVAEDARIHNASYACRFCNKYFFGENELFLHMQQAHEQCHLCKKAHPDRFVYYKDYNELEGEKCSSSRQAELFPDSNSGLVVFMLLSIKASQGPNSLCTTWATSEALQYCLEVKVKCCYSGVKTEDSISAKESSSDTIHNYDTLRAVYMACCAEHFRHEHYLCGHDSCLEKNFVVFQSEQELKQHTAREHAGGMSRAERRQALTIPIDISVSFRCRSDPATLLSELGRV